MHIRMYVRTNFVLCDRQPSYDAGRYIRVACYQYRHTYVRSHHKIEKTVLMLGLYVYIIQQKG